MIQQIASKCHQKQYKMRPPKKHPKHNANMFEKASQMTPKMMKNVSKFALEDPFGPQEAP